MVQFSIWLISSQEAFATLKRGMQMQWLRLDIDDSADAMGCLLMGGEL